MRIPDVDLTKLRNAAMSKQTWFVMVASPSAAGKTHAADEVANKCGASILALHNDDEIMKPIFDLVPKPPGEPELHDIIDQIDRWKSIVSSHADCNRLIRLHHRDWIARHWDAEVVLADGYLYMFAWYRIQVCQAFAQIRRPFKYLLVRYEPTIEEHVRRACVKHGHGDANYARNFIRGQWSLFECPLSNEGIQLIKVETPSELMEVVSNLN